MDMSQKTIKWCQAVKSGKLKDIAKDIKDFTSNHRSSKIDTDLLKIVLHVCHFATACDKSNTAVGVDIFNIIRATCSSFTTMPEPEKFFSALYHIQISLIDMKLYNEAQALCDFILPGSIWNKSNIDIYKKYAYLSNMWYNKIKSLIGTYSSNNERQFKILMNLIQFEMNIGILAIKDSHSEFVVSLKSYYDKLKVLENGKYEHKINKLIFDNFTRANVCLTGAKKYDTFSAVLRLLSEMILSKITAKDISSISCEISKILGVFKNCMKTDTECYAFFKLIRQCCTIFIKSVDQFTEEFSQMIKSYINNIKLTINDYGYNDNTMKPTFFAIAKFITRVIMYWEEYEALNRESNILKTLMCDMMSLANFLSDMFLKTTKNNCSCKPNCQVKNDLFNSISLKVQSLTILQNLGSDIPENLQKITVETIKHSIKIIIELKTFNCKCWIQFWYPCEARIFNIAALFEKIDANLSCSVYKSLCCGFNRLNAITTDERTSDPKNRLSASLHRISCRMYITQQFHESSIATALNAFISYKNPECKAFRMWTNIKHKNPHLHDTTILKYLESNAKEFEYFYMKIDSKVLDSLDKELMCLEEIKGLYKDSSNLSSGIIAALDTMELINGSPMSYIHGVVLLGYHLLHFKSDLSIQKYIKKALLHFENMQLTPCLELLIGHLKFFNFIERLQEIQNATEEEMQRAKIRLYATKEVNLKDPAMTVVPAYNLINIKTTTKVATELEKVLQIWIECFNKSVFTNEDNIIDNSITLVLVKIAAEYARFYKFPKFEIKAWKLTYNLAELFKDHQTLIYAASRSIMSNYVKNPWIQQGLKSVRLLKNSSNKDDVESIAMFKLSLSNLYFHTGKIEGAKNLLNEVVDMPGIEFTENLPTYLNNLDVLLSYGLNHQDDNTLTNYIETIIKGLYTMLIIEENMPTLNIRRDQFLYYIDALLQFSDHIGLRMNNLVSFREISAHLVRRLSIAQKLGSTLHAAECLKNLCYIDLSRNQLDDCEVKLQGLEHMLEMETFEESMKKKNSPSVNVYCEISPSRIIEPVRDIYQNDTSPVLPKKIFISPDFMQHNEKCRCFKCWNTAYQYSVFSCTYIRAQLYASQNQKIHALEHFEGAFKIIRKLLNFSENRYGHDFGYYHIVEYILFLLDIYQFFIHSLSVDPEEALNIVFHAIEICEKYGITNHPVYLNAKERVFEYQFQAIFNNDVYSTFVIPRISALDSDCHLNAESNNFSSCITPVRPVETKAGNRRKKSPPFLSLDEAFIDTLEDENDRLKLAPLFDKVEEKKKLLKVRPIRRKISDTEYSAEPPSPSEVAVSSNHLKTLAKIYPEKCSVLSRNKVTPSVTSGQYQLKESQQTTSIVKDTLKMHVDADKESKKTSSRTKTRSLKSNGSTETSNISKSEKFNNENKDIDEVINHFKELGVSESSLKSRSRGFNTNGSSKSVNEKSSTSSTSSTTVQKTSGRSSKVSDSESENELIEASYVEIRRSRRVANKKSVKEKTISNSVLKPRNL